MKTVLLRTGSVPVLPSIVHGSPKVSFSLHDSFPGVFSGEKNNVASPRISLHLEINRRNDAPARSIRRVFSETDVIRSESEVSVGFSRMSGVGSRSFPARVPEEEHLSEDDVEGGGSLILKEKGLDRTNYAGSWPESGIPVEEFGFPGDGTGKCGGGGGGEDGTGVFTGGNADRSKIGAYYQEMLKSNPRNSLLLRNYGKYLHEVEKDTVRAEEYYGRAILEGPGDGEVLSLYGKLIWETQRDEGRAKAYFDQALHASPDDCTVLGSYAHFMWEAEEDDEDEGMEREAEVSTPMVEAF